MSLHVGCNLRSLVFRQLLPLPTDPRSSPQTGEGEKIEASLADKVTPTTVASQRGTSVGISPTFCPIRFNRDAQ